MHCGNCNAEPTVIGTKIFSKIIVAAISAINQKMLINAAQKTKFSIKDFFSKLEQFRSSLWIWSHLLKKPLWKNSFFMQCNFYHCPTTFISNDITVFFSTK